MPMDMSSAKVRPSTRTLVAPSVPSREQWLPLSNLDRVVTPTFVSVIFFYRTVLSSGRARCLKDLATSLKQSLSKVLVDFYPLAGRLEIKEDGEVDLHCNNAGAIFFETSVSATLSELGGPQPMHMLSGLDAARLGPGPLYIPDALTPIPVLIVNVTEFKCGSIAVAVNWHHTVADGSAGCHFLRSWSEVARGHNLSLVPNHDRLLLRPRYPPDPSLVAGYSTRTMEEVCRVQPHALALKNDAVLLKQFHLRDENLLLLKAAVNADPNLESVEEARPFTSAECVSATLWRMMTRARVQEGELSDRKTRFFTFVDARKRMKLPEGYFGNVVGAAYAESQESDILHRPSCYAARLIRAATVNISDDFMKSLIDWLEVQKSWPNSVSAKAEHVISVGHDVAATFWTLFGLYDIDFGWGKAELGVRNAPPRKLIDGVAMMPSPEGTGNMVALLNLHPDRMLRLEQDPEFRALFP
ncbi:hypothetical protein Mapa_016278 [Marchantia paleacea]|nr:hypothetical protein Mapa_016278 [Marchantia paleacea]